MRSTPSNQKFDVYCVCGGFGFPFGTASTKRIRLIGKSLVSKGIPFHVLHIGASPFRENTQKCGVFDGLNFEYLSPLVRWPNLYIIRLFFYLWGCFHLFYRLLNCRKHSMVYCYYQGCFMNLWTLWLCRLMKIPVVQEACEWWPGTINETFFTKWMYQSIMFRWSNGAMPISHQIEDRIRSLCGPDYPLCRVPVLVDPAEKDLQPRNNINDYPSNAVFLWCGMVDGYKRDVLFLIDAVAKLKSSMGQDSILRIVGPCSEKVRAELLSYGNSKNISTERMDIVGFVSDAQLWNYCTQADALLMPLWEDDRSATRFPTKLGQYVVAGRPIITAWIGEIRHFLTDKTALFYPPGDASGFANCLEFLLNDKALGTRLASRATLEVLQKVNFRSNAKRIGKWFYQIYYSRV